MFEKASRLKLRFGTPRGLITVEDLWDLPLTVRGEGVSLDNLAKDLNKKAKESGEESFVTKKSKVNDAIDCKFNIVKRIIEAKLKEAENNEKEAMAVARKQQILEIIADKKEEGLKDKSIEDLEKMLENLPS